MDLTNSTLNLRGSQPMPLSSQRLTISSGQPNAMRKGALGKRSEETNLARVGAAISTKGVVDHSALPAAYDQVLGVSLIYDNPLKYVDD